MPFSNDTQHPEWTVEGDMVIFPQRQAVKADVPTNKVRGAVLYQLAIHSAGLPELTRAKLAFLPCLNTLQLINRTLEYAKEMEQIV
jgi:hypothetical protein